jgi:energy-coupling factor transport system permease protein
MRPMYVERVAQPSFFSRLDVRTKLMIMFLVLFLILVWENIFYQIGLFLIVLALALSAHLDQRQIRRTVLLMAPFMTLSILIQGFFNIIGKTAIITLFTVPAWVPLFAGPFTLYYEGLIFGLMVVFRLLSPILVMPLVVLTTDVNDLVLGLVKIRVPYKVAFIFSITLRFVPFIFGEIDAITEAQRLRGLALEKMGIIQRIPVFASLAVPLIIGSLLKAQTLDVVLQSKAFSGSPVRTYMREIRLRAVDYAIIYGGLAFFVLAVIMRWAFGWGAFVS